MSSSPALARRLGLADAAFIGLGSMIGAGVFSVWAPAAQAAGAGLLIGLAIAAVIAFCNATASAQLAAAHPTSGGTYAYGRAELGPWWGFIAGWCFVIGKLASCAAMALVFAAYAAPPGWERPVAVAAVVALATVNLLGVTRTAQLIRVIVVTVLLGLAVVVAAGVAAPPHPIAASTLLDGGIPGILQAAGLLFFAFAGYARIATMGEEVRDPARTIPRAIVIALGAAVAVYAVIAVVALAALGPALAHSSAPLADVATAAGWGWAQPVIRVAAAAASLGALLALIAGIGRTSLAMAREGDLPRVFAAVHPRWRVPHRAEIAIAIVVIAAVLLVDLRGAIGFSSFGVLLYYLIANLSALRQRGAARRYPRALQLVGVVGCAALALSLPWQAVAAGVAVVVFGVAGRAIRLRAQR
ncbi:MAG: APC family permease [Microbacteriaceae bacterium]|jgi:APA family basic amino acid/polyamine antiporter|nr:APC family permease [Microbacteriaceae bacterium]HOA86475.1 APC family permease [Microbacteriaceae bacterium]HPZ35377.1 APC family permease [Microbacteriaceae bacterium]HQC93142.1 APC family permease [Microbacteriaceae bacterium]